MEPRLVDRAVERTRSLGLDGRIAYRYLGEATAELARLRGSLGVEFVRAWGEEAAADEIGFWEVLVESLGAGAVRPGHVRARKPGLTPTGTSARRSGAIRPDVNAGERT